LRIDVDAAAPYAVPPDNAFTSSGLAEIWAYGLRNPWRISFDRQTGDLWIADVGQAAREEIDFQAAGSAGGQNYGWDCFEGTVVNNTDRSPLCANNPPVVAPIHEYDHSGGKCSITGGYVYRGPTLDGYSGAYFFADYCSDEMWTLRRTAGAPIVTKLTVTLSAGVLNNIRSFGQDATGELYVATDTTVYRVDDPSAAPVAPEVSAVDGAGNLVTINWGGNAANCNYEVHKGGAPYFTPAGMTTEQATIPATSPLTWDDPNGTGSVATTNYYLVRAFNCSSATAADSNWAGEFEFDLVEGA
jgi:hypothetical protein